MVCGLGTSRIVRLKGAGREMHRVRNIFRCSPSVVHLAITRTRSSVRSGCDIADTDRHVDLIYAVTYHFGSSRKPFYCILLTMNKNTNCTGFVFYKNFQSAEILGPLRYALCSASTAKSVVALA